MAQGDVPLEDRIIAILPNLNRYAYSLCRRHDVAEDLVQLAALRALESRASYDGATRIEPWMFRILRNAWIDMTRRTRTRGTELELSDAPEQVGSDGSRVTEARLMLDATERALATLPEEQREVLVLVCYEEMSYAETAEILGIPRGTVMSRLSRARVALAERLGIN
ncbi:RNA polymerase sigma factor [Roseivivax isoporae]|uniref:RNA polymerase sigma70 factor n=1 Tax=Roseivivax isoporae LMG 25204 TaxID=1449351 RepID=X7FBV8_9RHOB|nr:RNA polymerase sigma factor [Roseivivax isoporae]ETX30407.1 RNA polymerase sigma70 factor [Roseivivax isoporae LMG 25204]